MTTIRGDSTVVLLLVCLLTLARVQSTQGVWCFLVDTLAQVSTCDSNITALQLSRVNGLFGTPATNLSLARFTQLGYLSLNNNNITVLPSKVFSSLPLTYLDLGGNLLTNGALAATNNLTNLTTLSLDSNRITSLSNREFQNLPSLRTLSLNGNRISFIANDTFLGLTSLRELNLGNNYLTAGGLGGILILGNLQSLSLFGNLITTPLPNNTFSLLTSLQVLSLHSNFLDSLLPLRALPNLVELGLAYTGRRNTSFEDLAPLTKLEKLVIQDTRMASIAPGSLNSFKSLKSLDLSSNNLNGSALQELRNLTTLTELYLRQNQITSIGNEFEKLTNLGTLDLAENPLGNSSLNFLSSLVNLTYLDLRQTLISTLPIDIMSQLTKLFQLHLSSNFLEQDSFVGLSLPSLAVLLLRQNRFTSLSNSPFMNMPALFSLDLSLNNITYIDYTSFAGPESLNSLFLSQNKITSIGPSTFFKESGLTVLELQGNPGPVVIDCLFPRGSQLSSLKLPNAVTSVSPGSFNGLSPSAVVQTPVISSGQCPLPQISLMSNFVACASCSAQYAGGNCCEHITTTTTTQAPSIVLPVSIITLDGVVSGNEALESDECSQCPLSTSGLITVSAAGSMLICPGSPYRVLIRGQTASQCTFPPEDLELMGTGVWSSTARTALVSKGKITVCGNLVVYASPAPATTTSTATTTTPLTTATTTETTTTTTTTTTATTTTTTTTTTTPPPSSTTAAPPSPPSDAAIGIDPTTRNLIIDVATGHLEICVY